MKNAVRSLLAVILVVVIVLATITVANGTGGNSTTEPCVPSPAVAAYHTDWTNFGQPVRTEDNVVPGSDTDLSRWVFVGETEAETIVEAVIGVDQWWHWNGGNEDVAPTWPGEGWNTDNGNHNGLKNKDNYAPNTVFDAPGQGHNAAWFYHEFREAVDAVTDTDYLWQKQVRAFVPAVPEVVCETPSETPSTPTETVTVTPSVPTETTTVTPPVVTETVVPPVVTETVVPTPTPDDVQTPTVTPVPDKDCADFATQQAAQNALENGQDSLDFDGDGVACEVITKHTSSEPNKTVVTQTHEDGQVTKEVRIYEDAKEEGL